MPIEFTQEDKKKKATIIIKKERKENIFVECKQCKRPYKRGKNYPDEVCAICVVENEE